MKKIVYICSPFRMDREYGMTFARIMCAKAVDKGVVPYAPHLLFPQFLDDDKPADRSRALKMCMEMLRVVDELWVCGDVITEGMRGEIEEARRIGKTVRHIIADKNLDLTEVEM